LVVLFIWVNLMRQAVVDLVALGALPSERSADPVVIQRYETLIRSIQAPVTDEEATALVGLFGADDCFGLAWSLVHLIETAPRWPISECLQNVDSEWVRHLRQSAENARRLTKS
jgi:hypothetical protein